MKEVIKGLLLKILEKEKSKLHSEDTIPESYQMLLCALSMLTYVDLIHSSNGFLPLDFSLFGPGFSDPKIPNLELRL